MCVSLFKWFADPPAGTHPVLETLLERKTPHFIRCSQAPDRRMPGARWDRFRKSLDAVRRYPKIMRLQ
jgi:hypothetical protein